MYSKAVILALVAPLACATLVLQQPSNVASNSPVTISWSSNDPATDPVTFSIELVNQQFHNTFAIANNVLTSAGSITVTLPVIPAGSGYQVELVNIGNINDVFAISGDFTVAPAPSSSAASVGSTGASGTGTVSVTGTVSRATTSAFGTTVGSSATTPTSGSTGTLSGSQSSSATATSTKFNGAVSHSSTSYAALALSAFAGVALLAL